MSSIRTIVADYSKWVFTRFSDFDKNYTGIQTNKFYLGAQTVELKIQRKGYKNFLQFSFFCFFLRGGGG